MLFKLSCWDHARYVKNHSAPYDEMAREMIRKKALGIATVIAYMYGNSLVSKSELADEPGAF